jgi:hypothetical protein
VSISYTHAHLQFDALLLRRLISMSGSLARNVAMQQYGEQLGQALTAAAAVTGADSAAARSSVVNCLTKLDTVLEIPDDLKMEVRETALQVFMQQVRQLYISKLHFLQIHSTQLHSLLVRCKLNNGTCCLVEMHCVCVSVGSSVLRLSTASCRHV